MRERERRSEMERLNGLEIRNGLVQGYMQG